MGKWAKAHTTAKKKGLTPSSLKGIASAAKDDMSPDVPGETAEEKSLRNRQAMEIARLDEEENRRIKSMFAGGGGRKLFRSARSSAASRASGGSPASSGGSVASSGGSSYSGGYSGGSYGGGSGGRGTSALP